MKIYISGKISGLEITEAKRLFGETENRLIAQGHDVLNPLKNGLPQESSWSDHMREDIKMLMSADAIFLLDNWKDSRGAAIEFNLANELGMEVLHDLP